MAKLQRAAEQVKVNVRVERVRCAPKDTATDTDTFTDSTRVSDRFQCVPRCAKPTVNWNFNSTLPLSLQPSIYHDISIWGRAMRRRRRSKEGKDKYTKLTRTQVKMSR